MTAYGETVVHIPRTLGQDSDGNDAYTNGTPVTYEGVLVVPRDGNGTAGNELLQGRDTVIIGFVALLPPTTSVSAYDLVQWQGETYEVDGLPALLKSPFTGWAPGVQVAMKRVTG